MWTLEDLEAINPRECNQERSFLTTTIEIGAATPELLCRAAEILEERGPPYLIAFAQLPFPLDCGSEFFRVSGKRDGMVIDLNLIATPLTFSHIGQPEHVQVESLNSAGKYGPVMWITQVLAVLPLWGARTKYYEAYLDCLTPNGLRDRAIGRIENWMVLEEVKMQEPIRRHAPLTAQMFQSDVAHRVYKEIAHAIQSFLQAYSVVQLEELNPVDQLYGYFLMIAPGRLACAMRPVPVTYGFCRSDVTFKPRGSSSRRIMSILGSNVSLEDRMLKQLMAMNRLLKQGEPELALVGCVTAIEWFLNEKLRNTIKNVQLGGRSLSIQNFLDFKAISFLPLEMRSRLREVSRTRNRIVHGPPPLRKRANSSEHGLGCWVGRHVDAEFVHDALFLALDVYRTLNSRELKIDVERAAASKSSTSISLNLASG
jgi:hypothetical protein